MRNVLILMSTYNGEKFLSEQLDSIFAQKDVSVHLLVRDDGSSDSTISILREYQKSHPDDIDIIQGENIGWKKSFFSLAKLAEQKYNNYAYYAFSDQDDIWLPKKLIRALTLIDKFGDCPALYASNLSYYKNGKIFDNIRSNSITVSSKSCLIRNYATGCTILFNRQLLNLISSNFPDIDIAHDYWFYLVASTCGSVIIDPDPYVLYRQHESNQIGIKRRFRDVWIRRFGNLKKIIHNHEKELIAKELFKIYGDSMNHNAKVAVKKVAFYKDSLSNRLSLLFDNGYTHDRRSNDLWMKVKIIFGIL